MAKYDSEDLLESILSIMTEGDALNKKILAIDAEKSQKGLPLDPELKTINEDAFYCQTWSNKILNNNPAIFYGIEDLSSTDGGGVVAKVYKIFVEVVLVDDGQTNDFHKRISRYSRALEELFSEAYAPAIHANKIKIESVRPIAFKLELDSSEEIKVGGVSLTIPLA